MATTADRLTQLQKELEALRAIQTQEDFDEGARLHAEKNAPWVSGMYSHLKFPVYQYREFPKVLYHTDYRAAKQAWDAAHTMLVSGNDQSRELAIKAATREIDKTVVTVSDKNEEARYLASGDWAVTPAAAEERRIANDNALAVEAAHLNYEDRNLTGAALAERERADDMSDGHLVDVTATLARHRGRPKATAAAGA